MKKESHFTRCWLGLGGRQLGTPWERLGRSLQRTGDSSRETRETHISVSHRTHSCCQADKSGYSVEDRCKQVPFHEKKEHRGFLLAKRAEYINDKKLFSWPDMLPSVAESVPKNSDGKDFEFFGTYSGTLNPKLDHIRNVGPLDRPIWLEEVAKSKFMVSLITRFASEEGTLIA